MAETGMIRIKAKRNCRVAVLTDGVPTTLGARVRYDKVIEQTKSANSPSKQTKKPHFGALIIVAETERFELSCRLPSKRISSASRYDHFGTSPKHT